MFSAKIRSIFRGNKNPGEEHTFLLRSKEGSSKIDPSYGTNCFSEDIDVQERPPKYPVGVHFVLASKFFESFAANGVRSILALYLKDSLHFSRDQATIVLHIFNFFSQFMPIVGAILADCYIGNERSILYSLSIYSLGYIGITLTTIPLINNWSAIGILVYISLWLISMGNGSIRANITSLGASQFQLPAQNMALDEYFSNYYFYYTAGNLLSKTLTPSIRGMTTCFGESNCYLAVFGVLLTMFLMCFMAFLIGLVFYVKQPLAMQHKENVLLKVIWCVWWSLKKRILNPKEGNFLDNVDNEFDGEFIKSVKSVLNILKLFLPLPIYWALFAQQDSSWTFQATKMDNYIGDVRIQPDQMKAIAPLVLLVLIPLWNRILLPMIHSKTRFEISAVSSIALGGLFASSSFICSGFVEDVLQRSDVKTISILWQLPQFILLMVGEVLLAIPGIQFAFKEAPSSMKSVITAIWFMNNAFGNLIVVFVTELKPVQRESMQYFLYASLMMVGTIAFMFLARTFEQRQRKAQDTHKEENCFIE